MIHRHPDDETLGQFALGGLKAGARLVVATHLQTCQQCRQAVRGLERVGAAILETGEAAAVDPGALDRLMNRLDDRPAANRPGLNLQDLIARRGWIPAGPGVALKPLTRLADPGERLYLLKVRGGAALPQHGHNGRERLAVIEGAFEDEAGRYGPGDFAESDVSVSHQPRVMSGPTCICIASTDGPLRLTGMARLLQPLLGV